MNRLKMFIAKKTAAVLRAAVIFGLVTVMFPGYTHAQEDESEAVKKAEETEEPATVDSVQENAFVLNDSVVLLDRSILLYDQYGNRKEQSAFKVGDQVIVTSVEDEAVGEQRIVSIRLTKNSGQNSTSSERPVKRDQVIRKVNGVWTN